MAGMGFQVAGNLFRSSASKLITNHFEDTPREAVKANTLTASLLFIATNFCLGERSPELVCACCYQESFAERNARREILEVPDVAA